MNTILFTDLAPTAFPAAQVATITCSPRPHAFFRNRPLLQPSIGEIRRYALSIESISVSRVGRGESVEMRAWLVGMAFFFGHDTRRW